MGAGWIHVSSSAWLRSAPCLAIPSAATLQYLFSHIKLNKCDRFSATEQPSLGDLPPPYRVEAQKVYAAKPLQSSVPDFVLFCSELPHTDKPRRRLLTSPVPERAVQKRQNCLQSGFVVWPRMGRVAKMIWLGWRWPLGQSATQRVMGISNNFLKRGRKQY